jgi:hypothetical protein
MATVPQITSNAVKRLRLDLRSAAILIANFSRATIAMVSCVANGYHAKETL